MKLEPVPQEVSDQDFLTKLDESQEDIAKAAAILHGAGHHIELPAAAVRPTYADRMRYLDQGDLYVYAKSRIEIKRNRTGFWTGAHDHRFPTLIVCNAYRHRTMQPPPACYWIFNAPRTVVAVVPCNTIDQWWIEQIPLYKRGTLHDCYLCPVELPAYYTIEELAEALRESGGNLGLGGR